MNNNKISEPGSLRVWLSLVEQIRPTSAFAQITQLTAGRARPEGELLCHQPHALLLPLYHSASEQWRPAAVPALRFPNEDIRDLEAASFPWKAIFSVIPRLA